MASYAHLHVLFFLMGWFWTRVTSAESPLIFPFVISRLLFKKFMMIASTTFMIIVHFVELLSTFKRKFTDI